MKSFKSWDRTEIVYQEWGEQTDLPPVVLHHGFVVDANANWVAPGILDALLDAGRRVLAPDARGHGQSGKPHDRDSYGEQRMAKDLEILLDVCGEPQMDLVGCSRGAIVWLTFGGRRKRR